VRMPDMQFNGEAVLGVLCHPSEDCSHRGTAAGSLFWVGYDVREKDRVEAQRSSGE